MQNGGRNVARIVCNLGDSMVILSLSLVLDWKNMTDTRTRRTIAGLQMNDNIVILHFSRVKHVGLQTCIFHDIFAILKTWIFHALS